jgi:hypothetical protein
MAGSSSSASNRKRSGRVRILLVDFLFADHRTGKRIDRRSERRQVEPASVDDFRLGKTLDQSPAVVRFDLQQGDVGSRDAFESRRAAPARGY